MTNHDEKNIIELIREGKANKEIADDLHTTEGAVKKWVREIRNN